MRRTQGNRRPLAVKFSINRCFCKGSDGNKSVIDVYSKFDLEYSASSMCASDVGVNTDVDLGISPEDDSTIHVQG